MIADHRAALGITPRKISRRRNRPAPGVQRWSTRPRTSWKNGIASKASDIDMVYIFGYGFPVARGPAELRQRVGLFNVAAAMKRFARTRWTTPASGSQRRCWRAWWPKAEF